MKVHKTFELSEEEEILIGISLQTRITFLENEIKAAKINQEQIEKYKRQIIKLKELIKQF